MRVVGLSRVWLGGIDLVKEMTGRQRNRVYS
jgi:hypothetical protein